MDTFLHFSGKKKNDWIDRIGNLVFCGANLLDNKAGQDIHDKSSQSGVHGERLDDGAHEKHRERILLHQLLHDHRQDLRGVHILLRKAQVGSCSRNKSEKEIGSKNPLFQSRPCPGLP